MHIMRTAVLALCCALSQAANFENMRLFERLGFGRRVDEDAPRIQSLNMPGNSPMFMIKLPPSAYYYLNHVRGSGKVTSAPNFPRVPLDFTINGKPDKLYHYNLGVTAPMLDGTTPVTTTAATTVTTPRPSHKQAAAERLRQKYANYYKRKTPSAQMKKYKYAYNGKPSSFYVMRGSSNRKPIYYRRLE